MSQTASHSRPSVSIVLPTFDRLEYLRPALDSVFAQTWSNWDLVIADDGSGDELRSYLRGLEDRPRVKVVLLPHRGIPAAVRNAALREATGTHVAFLDSDDLWAPRKLELQMALLAARPECRWSYTAFRRVDRLGAPLAEERTRRWHPGRVQTHSRQAGRRSQVEHEKRPHAISVGIAPMIYSSRPGQSSSRAGSPASISPLTSNPKPEWPRDTNCASKRRR